MASLMTERSVIETATARVSCGLHVVALAPQETMQKCTILTDHHKFIGVDSNRASEAEFDATIAHTFLSPLGFVP
jgi:acyl dehydratase